MSLGKSPREPSASQPLGIPSPSGSVSNPAFDTPLSIRSNWLLAVADVVAEVAAAVALPEALLSDTAACEALLAALLALPLAALALLADCV